MYIRFNSVGDSKSQELLVQPDVASDKAVSMVIRYSFVPKQICRFYWQNLDILA